VSAVQSAHAPAVPQALSAPPTAHVPLLQQPPLHVAVVEQLALHTPPPCGQAMLAGQSAEVRQPHPPRMHWLPLVLEVQSVQTVLAPPQALLAVPGEQPTAAPWQSPAVQVGVAPAQAAQLAPPVPQVVFDEV
jgi:hypothetical protein